jgi:ectoine hydroxylase
MHMLTHEQVEAYRRDGFLFLPQCYSQEETQRIKERAHAAQQVPGEQIVHEKDAKTVRSLYGLHASDPLFDSLSRHHKLAQSAQALLDGPVYVYQSKLNYKAAFDGDVWDWHQDYIYWLREDGMPASHVLTAALFLDEINEFNGPLTLVPRSHQKGVLSPAVYDGTPKGYEQGPEWIGNLTAHLRYTVDRRIVSDLAREHGLVAPKGPAGSVLFFDGNVLHASQANISPFPRRVLLYTYNRVDNAPAKEGLRRPQFLVSRDTRPIEAPLADLFQRSTAGGI